MKAINSTPVTKYYDLQTDRLTLTPFAPAMLLELHRIFADADVRRYLMDDKVVPLEWVADAIATSQKSFAESNYGLWAIYQKDTEPIIGFCGYWYFGQLSYPLQLIYGLLPDYWGAGLATETAQSMIKYGFEQAGFFEIVAAADIPNSASFAVMKRLGMNYWKTEDAIDYYKLAR